MTKLVKKQGLGGFAETVDSSLNGLGTWGKLGVLILDPTGITGWKDFGDALKTFQKSGSLMDAGSLGLAALGAVPMFGMFKSAGKALSKLGKSAKTFKKEKALTSLLNKVVKECIDTKTISEANKKKILDISAEVDTLKNSNNSAENVFSFIQSQIAEHKFGGNIVYFK